MRSAILITGASTGIGNAAAACLAGRGYTVFAGVRTQADAQRVRAQNERIEPLILDVTRDGDAAKAAQVIERSGTPLSGVVNNAGIVVAGALEYLPIDELRKQFEVNVFGALAVTQAVLPLLRRSNGRIVFVSSVSGQIAPPYIGPYAASKFALEAMADALRMELAPFGIVVSVIQPGNVKTPIWQKGRDAKPAIMARMSAQALEHYGAAMETVSRLTQREERTGIAPQTVAQTILCALESPRPRARYAIGSPSTWQRRMAVLLPERVRDQLILKNFKNG
ncbi:MAG: SDR family oxidoreductase [Candidatus Baltobacteraceae bacterium]